MNQYFPIPTRKCCRLCGNVCVNQRRRARRFFRGRGKSVKPPWFVCLRSKRIFQLVELNMEKPWRFIPTLNDLNPRRTIEAIEFELNIDIEPRRSIIFFDEVQSCPPVLSLLRYFYEEAPEYRIMVTGSLLEFILSEPKFSIPVGRIELFYLGPLTFKNFCQQQEKIKQ